MLSLMQYYGFYKNVYSGEIVGLDHITEVFFAYSIIYCTALGFTKISITFLYFRILDGKLYRWLLWCTQVFNVLLICSFLIGLFLSCNPLPRYWIYSYDIVGTCSDVWDWGGYYMGLNLLLDIWLITLPSHYVWRAVLDRRTKIGVIAMFCLGAATMTMTAMRFVEMREDADTIAGDDLMQGILWGTLEVTTAFVIACMPATRVFAQRYFPVLATSVSAVVSGLRSGSNKRNNADGFSTVVSEDGGHIMSKNFGGGGRDRQSKYLAGTTLASGDETELEEIPLKNVEDRESRIGYAT
ncbi:unnamed protein product [Discula destructiva]